MVYLGDSWAINEFSEESKICLFKYFSAFTYLGVFFDRVLLSRRAENLNHQVVVM